MSYGITPIAVDLAEVRRAIGSEDEALLGELVAEFEDRLAEIEAMSDPDAKGQVTTVGALGHLIRGEGPDMSWWVRFKYGYALEMICLHFGEELPNEEWLDMRWEWAERVDEALGRAGVPADRFRMVFFLMTRGLPVDAPPTDDLPAFGHLLRDEMPAAREALDGADRAALDREEAAAIDQVRRWLESCMAAGRDLVCFYY